MVSKRSFILIAGGYLIILAIFSFIEYKVLLGSWNGIIVGNLLANAYWAPLGLLHFDRLSRQHHKEQMEAHKRTHDSWEKSVYGIRDGMMTVDSAPHKKRWQFRNTQTGQRYETIDPLLALDMFERWDWEFVH